MPLSETNILALSFAMRPFRGNEGFMKADFRDQRRDTGIFVMRPALREETHWAGEHKLGKSGKKC